MFAVDFEGEIGWCMPRLEMLNSCQKWPSMPPFLRIQFSPSSTQWPLADSQTRARRSEVDEDLEERSDLSTFTTMYNVANPIVR